MITPCWGRGWVFGYFPLGKLVNSYFPLGKLVSGLLPTGGEGGLHDYSPLGERVGFIFSSCWGSWFHGHSPLRGGGRVLWLLPIYKKKEKRGNISKRRRKEQRKARLNLYIYVLFTPFRVSSHCGRGWVSWILPAGGKGWVFMVTSHGGAGFWLLPKSRKKIEKLYIYIHRKRSKEQNKREIRGLKKRVYLNPLSDLLPTGRDGWGILLPAGERVSCS